jgi:hypothetical protein
VRTAYIASWLEALKNDKNEVFGAARAAAKATDYILKCEREQTAEPPRTPSASLPRLRSDRFATAEIAVRRFVLKSRAFQRLAGKVFQRHAEMVGHGDSLPACIHG